MAHSEVDSITVHCHLAEDLPQLWAEAHQLQHVRVNLVTNAHQALRDTAPPRHLTLTTAAKAERAQVTLEVADGSTIHLASQPGHGATERITLPVAAPDAQAPDAAPEPAAPAPPASASILVIDDEPGVRRALRRLLQRDGHAIATAANGHEGLAALEERSYEAILCDMRMPDLDGLGFYRELEHRHPHLLARVVFLTGDVLSPEAQAFFAQVDRPRLVKPFRAQEVRRVIQQVLAAR